MGSLFLFLTSCMNFNSKKVCKVGSEVLYEHDLEAIINIYFSDFEDEEARDLAIEQWANQMRINLTIANTLPEIQLTNIIQSQSELSQLNLFALENDFIENNLDTTITEDEIQSYYEKHRQNYQNQAYIVKALYVKLPDTVASVSKIDDYYLLNNDKDREEIKKYANLYATNFYFEEKRWIYFDDLVREIPMSPNKKNELIINRGKAKFSNNGETYYLNILDYKTKSVSSPLEAEKDVIRRHVLTQKINKLRNTAKETILKNAQENYPISYY